MSGTVALGTTWAYSRDPGHLDEQMGLKWMLEAIYGARGGAVRGQDDGRGPVLVGGIPDGEAAQVPPLRQYSQH